MKLYIAHVGFCDSEIGIHELHCNIFVVAKDVNAAKASVKTKDLYIRKKMHIDGIEEVQYVDGYEIFLKKTNKKVTKKISEEQDETLSLEYKKITVHTMD